MNLRSALLLVLGCIFFVSCKSPEARKPVQQSSGSFIKESAKRNKVLYKKEEARIASIMEANPEHDYLSSDRGFWYYYNVKDSLDVPTPDFGDVVTFTYNIQSLEGEPILTESETGLQTYKIDQSNQDLISGLRDGVKLMKVGEQVTFLFPSYKAYGYYGLEDKLGTNVPVRSTVTLKSIQQSQ
ncbi:gliding motility-associated peptidyl-prolyl isomerase GldI [Pukyongia salina]|uniref:Peptidyl-prolyl cis-trans isomerase n=1 Tax=Pukyongia salina TaxID=2094025 RepID=A0A2S0HSZ8_9FLAO|nr:gliding motility-associated peptidyl-prolyl isomerase GldI [Pukyongia salina]AVI49765.1 gliding motility-associated peptidyl-prolyl isomerase GldI [Pukyongia salina]